MITFNDSYPSTAGPIVHTLPLFHKLKILTIYDIYKLQVGKVVFENVNEIGPSLSNVNVTRATEDHAHHTR